MWCVYMCAILCVCVSHLVVYDSLWPPAPPPMDCRLPGSSGDGILQVRLWSGLPFPSPGDLPGIKPMSPAFQADSLLFESPWEHSHKKWNVQSACRTSESNKILYLNSIWIKIKLAMLLLYIVMFLTLDTNNFQSNHEMPEVKDFDFCKTVFIVTLSQLVAK